MCGCFHICRDIITVTLKGPCAASLRKHPFLLALRRRGRFARRRRARRNGCFRRLMCGTRFSPPKRRGTLGGAQYRNTLKKNWQIPKSRVKNRRNTETAFMIGHPYLELHPSSVMTSPTS